jgi:23S rRNA pseudouridine1911/1915/1917 synthase
VTTIPAASIPTSGPSGATGRAAAHEAEDRRAADAPLIILYEDEALLVADKPAGMVTHPAYKHPAGTLADVIFARQAALGAARPWLLHRLDRETSGVLLFAKTDAARRALVRQFERRSVRKLYLAITEGVPAPPEGVVEAALQRDPADRRRVIVDAAGQPAATCYRMLAATATHALVLARPLTGRMHQIRVHLASIDAPLLGDRTYLPADASATARAPRMLLHAWRLECAYPGTGGPFAVEAPPPADFAESVARLGLGAGLRALVDVATEEGSGLSPSIES